jgi:hypothetical protein
MDKQVYMALRVIKQGGDEKVEVNYKCILKLANYFHHQINDNLQITFFRTSLQPYLRITTVGMKRDTLFKHKEATITCEESMGDINEYWKLLEPLTKQEKTSRRRKICVICGQCNKLGHSKEHCHWNPNNPNNKLKDKKEVAMNGVLAQPSCARII